MNKKMIIKIFSALIRLIATTIYQPLVNIIISWKNILSGKNTSNYCQRFESDHCVF